PYWNLDPDQFTYTPQKVHVVRLEMPEQHTLGARVLYLDADTWRKLGQDAYDKQGNLLQQIEGMFRNYGNGGTIGPVVSYSAAINFRKDRATSLAHVESYLNWQDVQPSDISLEQLRKGRPYRP
ncbi:MAG: DUF1329 domain-containing protein, partial [bacterium]